MIKKKANSFGTFLETVQRQKTGAAAPTEGPAPEGRLLQALSVGPMPVTTLLKATGYPLSELLGMLDRLQNYGLVTAATGPADERLFSLSAEGRKAAELSGAVAR